MGFDFQIHQMDLPYIYLSSKTYSMLWIIGLVVWRATKNKTITYRITNVQRQACLGITGALRKQKEEQKPES